MELNHIDDTTTDTPSWRLSMILYLCSWVFFIVQSWTADVIWTWTFRGLSGVSLLLIIYINWNKAMEIFRGKNKKVK
jgi:hypothetical protein